MPKKQNIIQFTLYILLSLFVVASVGGHYVAKADTSEDKQEQSDQKNKAEKDENQKSFEQACIKATVPATNSDIPLSFYFLWEATPPLLLEVFYGSPSFLVPLSYVEVLFEHFISPNAP